MASDFDKAFNAAFDGVEMSPPQGIDVNFSGGVTGVVDSIATGVGQMIGVVPTGSTTGLRDFDHYGDFNFQIEIDGVSAGSFQKCEGLSIDVDIITWRDGMDPYPRKKPGNVNFGTLKLTKGRVASTALWDWCKTVIDGSHKTARKGGAVHVLSDNGAEKLATYRFIDAFPKRWSGFKMDGKGQGGLVEEIEIEVEYFMKENLLTGIGAALNPFS